jgi:hypothetical protein
MRAAPFTQPSHACLMPVIRHATIAAFSDGMAGGLTVL